MHSPSSNLLDLYSDTGPALAKRVENALISLVPHYLSKVECRALESTIRLCGECDSLAAKNAIGAVTRKVPGVRKVVNSLHVRRCGQYDAFGRE